MSRFVKVLDYGYVKFIDRMGSDEAVVEAARMSTGKGFLGWDPGPCPVCNGRGQVLEDDPADGSPCTTSFIQCASCDGKGEHKGDMKLLRYLRENRHDTPFEFASMVIEVQAPIFVFREWHRHRTFSFNEMSARYTPLPDLNYVPTLDRVLLGSDGKNKQAGTINGAGILTEPIAVDLLVEEREFNAAAERLYQKKLRAGFPKELARTHLGVSRYSRMRASANLRNWLAFLTLRMDSKAQWEIRQYANVVGEFIKELHPRTWELFQLGAQREDGKSHLLQECNNLRAKLEAANLELSALGARL